MWGFLEERSVPPGESSAAGRRNDECECNPQSRDEISQVAGCSRCRAHVSAFAWNETGVVSVPEETNRKVSITDDGEVGKQVVIRSWNRIRSLARVADVHPRRCTFAQLISNANAMRRLLVDRDNERGRVLNPRALAVVNYCQPSGRKVFD